MARNCFAPVVSSVSCAVQAPIEAPNHVSFSGQPVFWGNLDIDSPRRLGVEVGSGDIVDHNALLLAGRRFLGC